MTPSTPTGVDLGDLAGLIAAISALLGLLITALWRVSRGRDPGTGESPVHPVQGQTVSLPPAPPPAPDLSPVVEELRSQIRRIVRESRAHERRADWWERIHRRHMATRHPDEPEPHYPGDD